VLPGDLYPDGELASTGVDEPVLASWLDGAGKGWSPVGQPSGVAQELENGFGRGRDRDAAGLGATELDRMHSQIICICG
jgi:hypothetical protein